jgi:hypothetical protein
MSKTKCSKSGTVFTFVIPASCRPLERTGDKGGKKNTRGREHTDKTEHVANTTVYLVPAGNPSSQLLLLDQRTEYHTSKDILTVQIAFSPKKLEIW